MIQSDTFIFFRICRQWQFTSYSLRYRRQYDRQQLFPFQYHDELLQYCFDFWQTVPQTKSYWPIPLLKRVSDSTLTHYYRTTFLKDFSIFVACLLSVKPRDNVPHDPDMILIWSWEQIWISVLKILKMK